MTGIGLSLEAQDEKVLANSQQLGAIFGSSSESAAPVRGH
jgi:hypothetical protein